MAETSMRTLGQAIRPSYPGDDGDHKPGARQRRDGVAPASLSNVAPELGLARALPFATLLAHRRFPLRRLFQLDVRPVLALLGAQVELDRHVVEAELVAEHADQVALIGGIEQLRAIGEQHD